MDVIVLANPRRAYGRFHLGRVGTALLLLGMVLVGMLLVYAGFRYGAANPTQRPDVYSNLWREELQSQRDTVDEAIRSAEDNLGALALRLGEMQGQLIRLDALGERLVELSKLDKAEFEFGGPPPTGGPESPAFTAENHAVPDFLQSLEAVAAQLDDLSPKLAVLESMLMTRELEAEVRPSGRPVNGGWISSYYGYRTDPLNGKRAFHEGIDFAGKPNSDVVAVAAGVVTSAGYRYGYGRMVEINHGNGFVTRYAHNNKNLVKVGERVEKRQRIALMGSTGRSTGPHVHFEVVRRGKPVNPIKYVRARN